MRIRLLLFSLISFAAVAAFAGRATRLREGARPANATVLPVVIAGRSSARREWLAPGLLTALAAVLAVYLATGWSALAVAQQDQLHDTPRLLSPRLGEVITTTLPVLQWRSPRGATQYELELTPLTRLGSGIHMYGGSITRYQPPAPPAWCCIEPDMLYSWRVRVSFAEAPVTPDDSDAWGPWAEGQFYVGRDGDDEPEASALSQP